MFRLGELTAQRFIGPANPDERLRARVLLFGRQDGDGVRVKLRREGSVCPFHLLKRRVT
jgi:hypothetical protein